MQARTHHPLQIPSRRCTRCCSWSKCFRHPSCSPTAARDCRYIATTTAFHSSRHHQANPNRSSNPLQLEFENRPKATLGCQHHPHSPTIGQTDSERKQSQGCPSICCQLCSTQQGRKVY